MTPEEIAALVAKSVKDAMAAQNQAPKTIVTPPPPEGSILKMEDMKSMFKENTALQTENTALKLAVEKAKSEKDSFVSENTTNFSTIENHKTELKARDDIITSLRGHVYKELETIHKGADEKTQKAFDLEKYKDKPLHGVDLLNRTRAIRADLTKEITEQLIADGKKKPGGSTAGGGPAGGDLSLTDTSSPAESQAQALAIIQEGMETSK